MKEDTKKDFLISYAKLDEKWATWIAEQLENEGHTTYVQAWDLKAGNNSILEIHNASIKCKKTIIILSKSYFKSLVNQVEWASAFAKDPTGEERLLIPIRIEEFEPDGLFLTMSYIDLIGLNKEEAFNILIKNIDTSKGLRNSVGFPGTRKVKFPGELPVNNIYYKKNPNFIGRDEVFEKISNSFNSGKYIALTQAISGLGGIGKTQIALEYVFRYGYSYDLIWWVNSESSTSIFESYLRFAQEKGIVDKNVNEFEVIIKIVRDWMNANNNWLFIYDNCDDVKSILDCLPKFAKGHILITSRYTDWSSIGQTIRVDIFTKEEAQEFLINRTRLENCEELIELIKELGYLPLALEQASAYIINNSKTYKEYLDLFKKYKLEVMSKYKPNEYDYSVATTWQISIEKIKNESAKQLLNICAFISPDSIKITMFKEGRRYLPEPLKNELSDELKLDDIIFQLKKYSLISENKGILSIHRLLQEVILKSLDLDLWCKYSIDLLYNIFRFDYNNTDTWTKCLDLLPHALLVAEYGYKFSLYPEYIAFLFNETAFCLSETMANYKQAEPLFLKSFELNEKVFGSDHINTLDALMNLATAFIGQGNHKDAESLYKRVLESYDNNAQVGHEKLFKAILNLAQLYDVQGRYPEEECLYRRAIEMCEKLKVDNIAMSTLYNNLGGFYSETGRYTDAIPLLKEALKMSSEILGEDHPNIAKTLNNLAESYRNLGDYKEAELLYNKTIQIFKNHLGEEHPIVAGVMCNLALVYDNQEKYEDAESLYKKSLEIQENTLDTMHYQIGNSLNCLATMYRKLCRYEEAEALFKRALIIRKNSFGIEHPSTATTLNNLGVLYFYQGKYEDAEEFLKKAFEIRVNIFGILNAKTNEVFQSLSDLYLHQNIYEKIDILYDAIIENIEKLLGINHPIKAYYLNQHASVCVNLERYNDAETLYKKAYEIIKCLGEDNEFTRDILNNLIKLYEIMERYDEIENIKKKLGLVAQNSD